MQVDVNFGESICYVGLKDVSVLNAIQLNDGFIATKDVVSLSLAEGIAIVAVDYTTQSDPGQVIKAYDTNGTLLWCIGDVLPDLTGVYLGGQWITRDAARTLPHGWTALSDGRRVENVLAEVEPSHVLYACFDAGWRYVLDATDKRLLFRTPTK